MTEGFYPPRTVHDSPLEYPPGLWLARRGVEGHQVSQIFGHCILQAGVLSPIIYGNVYRTPQANAATPLRIKAGGNAADTVAGSGARQIKLTGLNSLGEMIEETINTAGASASAPTAQSFLRLLEASVVGSGTYGTQTTGSHVGAIVIEAAAGEADWGTIGLNGFPAAQAQIGVYTVPKGKTAYMTQSILQAESAKLTSFLLFKRERILDLAPPYAPILEMQYFPQVSGSIVAELNYPLAFPELTDFGFMGIVAGQTANVSSAMEIILVDNA